MKDKLNLVFVLTPPFWHWSQLGVWLSVSHLKPKCNLRLKKKKDCISMLRILTDVEKWSCIIGCICCPFCLSITNLGSRRFLCFQQVLNKIMQILARKTYLGISIKLGQVNLGFDLLGHQPSLATSQHETTHWVWVKKNAIF